MGKTYVFKIKANDVEKYVSEFSTDYANDNRLKGVDDLGRAIETADKDVAERFLAFLKDFETGDTVFSIEEISY